MFHVGNGSPGFLQGTVERSVNRFSPVGNGGTKTVDFYSCFLEFFGHHLKRFIAQVMNVFIVDVPRLNIFLPEFFGGGNLAVNPDCCFICKPC